MRHETQPPSSAGRLPAPAALRASALAGAEVPQPDLAPANHVAASPPPAAALGAADVPQQEPAAAAATPAPVPPVAAGGAAGQSASAAVTPPGEASGAKPRAQKTPYQKEALEAAYKRGCRPCFSPLLSVCARAVLSLQPLSLGSLPFLSETGLLLAKFPVGRAVRACGERQLEPGRATVLLSCCGHCLASLC